MVLSMLLGHWGVRALFCSVVVAFSQPCFAEWFGERQAIMGTEVGVYLWHDNETDGRAAVAAVMAEMHRIDSLLSPYIKNSELSRVNASAAKSPQKISAEFFRLVEKSLEYSQLSQGAFDITFASVGHYYDYRTKLKPSAKQRQQLLTAVNYHHLKLSHINSTLAFKHTDVRVDLGGIAKGYAVDRAIALLQDRGVKHASISAGGDSRVLGDKRGRPWLVGIQNPRDKSADTLIMLPLENTAISTSGDYERFFLDVNSGERIHHIINPRTGQSSKGVMSVTVIGPQGFDTDPLSTTVFVLGLEKGLALVNQLPEFDCVIIDDKGLVHYSQGLAPPEQITHSPE